MKLTTDRIVDAGLAVYADVGYHGLSMRAVAGRLDVHAGSLYYHVPDKAALVALMSDQVAQRAFEAGSKALAALPDDAPWQARIRAQVHALRATIRSRPGGAELLAAGPALAGVGAMQISERLLATLVDGGVPAPLRRAGADALLSYVTGFVLQEQGAGPVSPEPGALAELTRRFPLTLGSADAPEDETFAAGVALWCAGIAAATGP